MKLDQFNELFTNKMKDINKIKENLDKLWYSNPLYKYQPYTFYGTGDILECINSFENEIDTFCEFNIDSNLINQLSSVKQFVYPYVLNEDLEITKEEEYAIIFMILNTIFLDTHFIMQNNLIKHKIDDDCCWKIIDNNDTHSTKVSFDPSFLYSKILKDYYNPNDNIVCSYGTVKKLLMSSKYRNTDFYQKPKEEKIKIYKTQVKYLKETIAPAYIDILYNNLINNPNAKYLYTFNYIENNLEKIILDLIDYLRKNKKYYNKELIASKFMPDDCSEDYRHVVGSYASIYDNDSIINTVTCNDNIMYTISNDLINYIQLENIYITKKDKAYNKIINYYLADIKDTYNKFLRTEHRSLYDSFKLEIKDYMFIRPLEYIQLLNSLKLYLDLVDPDIFYRIDNKIKKKIIQIYRIYMKNINICGPILNKFINYLVKQEFYQHDIIYRTSSDYIYGFKPRKTRYMMLLKFIEKRFNKEVSRSVNLTDKYHITANNITNLLMKV